MSFKPSILLGATTLLLALVLTHGVIPVYKPASSDLTIFLGRKNENCDDSCSEKQMLCSFESLQNANQYFQSFNLHTVALNLDITCESMDIERTWSAVPLWRENSGQCVPSASSRTFFDCAWISTDTNARRICACHLPEQPPNYPGWNIITYDNFEEGFGNFETMDVNGEVDANLIRNTEVSHSGQYSIRLRDNTGIASSIYLSRDHDITSFMRVKVNFWFYVSSLDSSQEDFLLEYSPDGGLTWFLVKAWIPGYDIENDRMYHEEIILNSGEWKFTDSARIRFRLDASGNGDRVFIDDIAFLGLSTIPTNHPTALPSTTPSMIPTVLPSTTPSFKPSTSDQYVNLFTDNFEDGFGHFERVADSNNKYDVLWWKNATVAHSGDYTIQLRDNSGDASSLILAESIDLSSFETLRIDFWMYVMSLDNQNEDLFLEFSSNGGATWEIVKQWKAFVDLFNDQSHHEIVSIASSDFDFAAQVKIRFRLDASGNYDMVFIDDVSVDAQYVLLSSEPTSQPSTSPTVSVSPSTFPSLSPSSSPSSSPSGSPSGSPSMLPSTSPTTSPSTSPTITPTSSPSASPTTSPTLFDGNYVCNAKRKIIPGGTDISIYVSTEKHLCTLTLVSYSESKESFVPIARSYDGFDWETVAGIYSSNLVFDCSNKLCDIRLPAIEISKNSSYVLSSYSHELSHEEELSRFLQQASFGPQKHEIENWNFSSYAHWIDHQMLHVGATGHRQYWRERANARATRLQNDFIAITDKPCEIGSRWKKYAFSYEDKKYESELNVTIPDSSSNYFHINVDGMHRTEVDQATWSEFISVGLYELCNFPDEREGGSLRLRKKGESACTNAINPKVEFWESLPENTIELTSSDSLVSIDLDEIVGEGFLLNQKIEDEVCETLPSNGGEAVFIRVAETNSWYLHDPRIALQENQLQRPLEDGGGANAIMGAQCANVPRTFLNSKSCRLSTDEVACGPYVEEDAGITLDDSTVRDFFRLARRFVYALNMTEPYRSPCVAGSRSRWWKVEDANDCIEADADDASLETLRSLISSNSDSNPFFKDIFLPENGSAGQCIEELTTVEVFKNGNLLAGSTCWKLVHHDQYNVFDFTEWASIHPGGQYNIKKWATEYGTPVLTFPYYKNPIHDQSRWEDNKDHMTYIGRYGDVVRFQDLPQELRVASIAEKFGAIGERQSGSGVIICGSPGEASNNPELGNEFDIAMDRREDKTGTVEDFEAQKQSVWTSIALYGNDQLRQRVAWALNQILTMAVGDIDAPHQTEPFLAFYDIFVRHAFGNYRDILKEVSQSPMMAEMLSYMNSKSMTYVSDVENIPLIYPDENFAREIMQLFSIGLYRLNIDGTHVLDANGTALSTYNNDDIMDGARAWTGYTRQTSRGNIEDLYKNSNRVDPLKSIPEWHDVFPKKNLNGGYIGDGLPLCLDVPDKDFLRKGAKYRLLGSSSSPELQNDPLSWVNDPSIVRVVLDNSGNSDLYNLLCNKNELGECEFEIEVDVETNIQCYDKECIINQPRVVQVNDDIFYEYIRPTCVQFPFYDNALKIKTRESQSSKALCANPKLPVAGAACCTQGRTTWSVQSCEFTGERVTYDTSLTRCNAVNGSTCSWSYVLTNTNTACGPNQCCKWSNGYYWSNAACLIKAKINPQGQIGIIHEHLDYDDNGNLKGNIPDSFSSQTNNYFRVNWTNGYFPQGTTCTSNCMASTDGSCICLIEISEQKVFDSIPAYDEAKSQLKIGGLDPAMFESCQMMGQSSSSPESKIVIGWNCHSSNIIDEKTIFELRSSHNPIRFLKNSNSMVEINNGEYKFRNPPHFMSFHEQDRRDQEYETDAVIDQYFYHKNAAPFLALRLIQRFGISNPSPHYIKAVATAFQTGLYESQSIQFGDEKYGDMKATVAAILLHQEARSVVLDADPSYGSLREPLLKLVHLMRSLEFQPSSNYYSHVKMIGVDEKIGQMAHAIPSVFSFFLSDFVPPGRVSSASLVSPEAQKTNTPTIIGILDGMFSLIKYGLSECYGGFGPRSAGGCRNWSEGEFGSKSRGQLTYSPSTTADVGIVVEELSMLLTAGRMKSPSLDLVKDISNDGSDIAAKLRIAQQLIVSSPEFHSTNLVSKSGSRPSYSLPTPSTKPYKAIVYFFLEGGADTYNMLVPREEGCQSLYQMYKDTRKHVALESNVLLPIDAGNSQSCSTFGLHPSLSSIQTLYNQEEALFFTNAGFLMEPVTLTDWQLKHAGTQLFAHDVQRKRAKEVDAFEEFSGTGVLGRMTDVLTEMSNGYKTGSITLDNTAEALTGEENVSPYINFINKNGVTKFDEIPSSERLHPAIKDLNEATDELTSGIFGETWSSLATNAINENSYFYDALSDESLTSDFPTTDTGKKLGLISRLIIDHDKRGTDRDVFYASLGGWDTHSDMMTKQVTNFEEMNEAFNSFVTLLKDTNMWNDIVVVVPSEFGRTLTPNSGSGTDHGWGGNYILMGGDVSGKKILGNYPSNFEDYDVGRGRIYPTLSWDSIWNGVAEWFGITDSDDLDKVLPNRHKFDNLFSKNDLFHGSSTTTNSRRHLRSRQKKKN